MWTDQFCRRTKQALGRAGIRSKEDFLYVVKNHGSIYGVGEKMIEEINKTLSEEEKVTFKKKAVRSRYVLYGGEK